MSGVSAATVPTPSSSNIRNTTLFTYSAVTGEDKKMLSSAVYTGYLTAADSTKLRSRTYYTKVRGEEKADYSESYRPDGTVREQTEFFYGASALRATDASIGADSVLVRQDTYLHTTAGARSTIQSKSYLQGNVGEEKANVQVSYDSSGTAKTTTKFIYTGDALTTSYLLQGDQNDAAKTDKLNTANKTFQSSSVYTGPEGDEQVTRPHSYMSGVSAVPDES